MNLFLLQIVKNSQLCNGTAPRKTNHNMHQVDSIFGKRFSRYTWGSSGCTEDWKIVIACKLSNPAFSVSGSSWFAGSFFARKTCPRQQGTPWLSTRAVNHMHDGTPGDIVKIRSGLDKVIPA